MSWFPYRWRFGTVHKNLFSFVEDIRIGCCNAVRWAPIVWKDQDFDSHFLMVVMEYKLLRMAKVFDNGHLMHCKRRAKTCRIAATLLRRLMDDNYHADWETTTDPEYFLRGTLVQRNDQKCLGAVIGKHLSDWWD